MKTRVLFVSCLALLFFIGGCSCAREADVGPGAKSGDQDGAVPKDLAESQILIFARDEDSKTLDPQEMTDGESAKVAYNVYETLVAFDLDSCDLVPELAEKWTVSEDGKRFDFFLRKNVLFHNGESFNADAVVFTFNRLTKGENLPKGVGKAPYGSFYNSIESVVIVDDYHVEVNLEFSDGTFLKNCAMFSASIVSPESLTEDVNVLREGPIGTGPFRFLSMSKGERIMLEGNPDYWGGKPYLDRLVFEVVKDNQVRVQKLVRGDVQFIDNFSFDSLDQLSAAKGVVVDEKPGCNVCYLVMNLLHEDSPLTEVAVRRAIALSLDINEIIKLAYKGKSIPAPTAIPPGVTGRHEGITELKRDVSKAKELLANAGYADGLEIELWYGTNSRPYMPKPPEVALVVRKQLGEAGIKVKFEEKDWGAYLTDLSNAKHQTALIGWTTDNGDPDNFLTTFYHTKMAVLGAANNYSFYSNPEVDALLDKGLATKEGPEREAIYRAVQEIVAEDLPIIPLVHGPNIVAYRETVKGYHIHPTGAKRFKTVYIAKK